MRDNGFVDPARDCEGGIVFIKNPFDRQNVPGGCYFEVRGVAGQNGNLHRRVLLKGF